MQRLLDEGRDIHEDGSVGSARDALGEALVREQRFDEAVSVFEQALTECSEAAKPLILLKMAAAYLSAHDDIESTRAALTAVALAPETYTGLMRSVIAGMPVAAARSLDSWVRGPWIKQRTMQAAGAATRSTASGVLAAAALSRGDHDQTVRDVARARREDEPSAHAIVELLAVRAEQLVASDELDNTARFAVLARANHACGNEEVALSIARSVIDLGLTGENHPEAECRLIVADSPGVSADEKATHLFEAARLIGERQGKRHLARSLDLFARAAEEAPYRQEIYWYWADNQRVSAVLNSQPNSSALLKAAEIWDQGRSLGPSDSAWAHLVEANICRALATVGDDDLSWAMRELRAATDALALDPRGVFPWSYVSSAANQLNLAHTCVYAARRCAELQLAAPEPIAEACAEILAAAYVMCPIADAEEWLRRYMEAAGKDSAWQEWTIALKISSGEWSRALAMIEDTDGEPTTTRIFQRAYALVLMGDDAADMALQLLMEHCKGDLDVARSEAGVFRAWAHLLAEDEAACRTSISELAADSNSDWQTTLILRMLCDLLGGRADDALATCVELEPVLLPGSARELVLELDWMQKRCHARGQQESVEAVNRMKAVAADVVDGATPLLEQSPEPGVDEMDRRWFDTAARGLATTDLSRARATFSWHALPRSIDPDDWPLLFRVELGDRLVPEDAAENWREWVLFAELIPQARDRMGEALGFPVMGVGVRSADDLRDDEYRVTFNGMKVSSGTVSAPPPPHSVVATCVDGAPWLPPISTLEQLVLAAPDQTFVPHAVESLIAVWRELPGVDTALCDRIANDLSVRVKVWQQLRTFLLDHDSLPAWDEGLGEIVIDAVTEVAPTAVSGGAT